MFFSDLMALLVAVMVLVPAVLVHTPRFYPRVRAALLPKKGSSALRYWTEILALFFICTTMAALGATMIWHHAGRDLMDVVSDYSSKHKPRRTHRWAELMLDGAMTAACTSAVLIQLRLLPDRLRGG
jgi:hypothetical protein